MPSNFDTVTIGILGLLVGMSLQPGLLILLEFWLSRPRTPKFKGYYDHCRGCSL